MLAYPTNSDGWPPPIFLSWIFSQSALSSIAKQFLNPLVWSWIFSKLIFINLENIFSASPADPPLPRPRNRPDGERDAAPLPLGGTHLAQGVPYLCLYILLSYSYFILIFFLHFAQGVPAPAVHPPPHHHPASDNLANSGFFILDHLSLLASVFLSLSLFGFVSFAASPESDRVRVYFS